ncbi:hypothetical protein [Thermogymnomonas acidicola]|uniref:hypothetical protein n=1 Tax=Thermogymnomonas acidicola TaxID=399579 RepID=UPI000946618E|nr:hypothetical protein [Thermogymnomonas acidicola]
MEVRQGTPCQFPSQGPHVRGGITVYRASETAYHVLRPTPRVEILPSEGYTAVEVGSGIEVAGSTDRSVFFLFSRKI